MPKRSPPSQSLQNRVRHAFYATMSFALSQRRGYSDWLFASSDSTYSAGGGSLPQSGPPPGPEASLQRDSLGVVVHAYYPDVFPDIIEHLNTLPTHCHLYVTTPPESEAAVSACLPWSEHPYTLLICENRGKDILPFLKVAPLLIENGHDCFLKIHTKKSPHRRYGFFWRNDMFFKLLTPRAVQSALDAFENDPGIGIIAPKDHLLPMTDYSKSIEERIIRLAERVGVSKDVTLGLRFAAGTMFFARTECVLPLLDLSLEDEDFESEHGQIDGTLAHVMERLFAVAAESLSLRVVDTGYARRIAARRLRGRGQGAAGARDSGSDKILSR